MIDGRINKRTNGWIDKTGNRQLSSHLNVGGRNLEGESDGVVSKGVIEGDDSSVNSRLQEVAAVLLQADPLHPPNHSLVAPHQHVWGGFEKMSWFCGVFLGLEVVFAKGQGSFTEGLNE